MSSVRRSATAKLAARLTAVVVFPTPPFWLAIAMMRATGGKASRVDKGRRAWVGRAGNIVVHALRREGEAHKARVRGAISGANVPRESALICNSQHQT